MIRTLAQATPIKTISLEEAQVGDAVFCHSAGFFGAAIRLGQALNGFPPAYRVWNHVAWLDAPVKDAQGKVVDYRVGQAIAKGVDNTHLLSTIAPGGRYEIVSLKSFPTITEWPINREIVLTTLREQVGDEYGYLTIAAEVFNILTPHWINVDFRRDDTWICSGLFAYALHAGGAKIENDLYHIFPAELAQLAASTNA